MELNTQQPQKTEIEVDPQEINTAVMELLASKAHGKVKGLCTEEEFCNLALRYIISIDGTINLDIQNLFLLLSESDENDALTITGDIEHFIPVLQQGIEHLKQAHPDRKIRHLMMQLIIGNGKELMLSDLQKLSNAMETFEEDSMFTFGFAKDQDTAEDLRICLFACYKPA